MEGIRKEGRRRVGWSGRSGETGADIIEKVRCEQSLKALREGAKQRWGKNVAGRGSRGRGGPEVDYVKFEEHQGNQCGSSVSKQGGGGQ